MDKNDYKKSLLESGILGFVTHGNSMWPFIKNKKTSVIVTQKEERLKVFDVAFYERANGDFVLHRVLEVTEDGYVVSGDSQTEKEVVKESDVYGVLCGYYQGKKYIDCGSSDYIDAVKKWYSDEAYRQNKIKKYYKRRLFKSRLKKLLTLGRKN